MNVVVLEGHKKQLWHHLGMRFVEEIDGHAPWDILIPASALKSDNKTPWHRCPFSPLLSPSPPLNLPLFSLYYPIPLSTRPPPLQELEGGGSGLFSFHLGEGEITADSPWIRTSFTGKGGSARCLLCMCLQNGEGILSKVFGSECQDKGCQMKLYT